MLPTVEQRLNKAAERVYEHRDTHYAFICVKGSYDAHEGFWVDVWVEWLKYHSLDDLEDLLVSHSPTITVPCITALTRVFLGDGSELYEQGSGERSISRRVKVEDIEVNDGQFVNVWCRPVSASPLLPSAEGLYLGCINEGDFTGSLYQYTIHYQMTK